MHNARYYSLGYRFLRTLMPSPISMLASIVTALAIVGGYLVSQSVSLGTSLPDIFDGEWGVAYTNNIVQPLATIFSNDTIGKATTAFMWGLGGLALYAIVELATSMYRGLHDAESGVQLTDTTIIRHPALRSFFIMLLWRIAVVAIFSFLFATLILPVTHSLGASAPLIVLGQLSILEIVQKLVALILGFALSLHLIVVFLRLFLMRMRIFSEAEY